MSVVFDESILKKYQIGKVFRKPEKKIKSMDFHSNGETLVTCDSDDCITLYDCLKGT